MRVKTIEVDAGIITNCYLIIKDNTCLIVDPGAQEDKIINEIGSLKPLAILITHHHFDHIGAVSSLKNNYHIPVIDYKDYLNDDKILNINNFDFRIIETKGHSEDSVSYYFFKDKVLFSGDFIFLEDIGRCDLKGGDFNKMQGSLRKLLELPEEIKIYPGHEEETTLAHEKKYNEYLQNI